MPDEAISLEYLADNVWLTGSVCLWNQRERHPAATSHIPITLTAGIRPRSDCRRGTCGS